MPVVETITATRRISMPRTCSKCRATWNYVETHKGFSSDTYVVYSSASAAQAQQDLAENIKRLEDKSDCGVLCPQCGNFAAETVAKHFSNGFKRRLVDAVAKARRVSFSVVATSVVLFGCLAARIALGGVDGPMSALDFVLVIACIVAGGLFFAFSTSILWIFALTRRLARETLTDSEAMEWLQRACRFCNGGSGEDPKTVAGNGSETDAYSLWWIDNTGMVVPNLYKARLPK